MKHLIFLTLMLLTLWVAIGCHSSSQSSISTDCNEVQHSAGVTCVPKAVKRLVTLDAVAFENAIALGLTPIGTVLSEQSIPYVQSQQQTVIDVGQVGTPNLERILMLKPDLILGLSFNQEIYAQVSQIAPTVLLELDYSGQWKSLFHRFGEVLHRSAIANQVIQEYDDRLQAFKKHLGAASPKVSVVRVYSDTISLYLRDSFAGVILQDAGLERPESQSLSASEGQEQFGNQIQAIVGLESVEQADGDIMFIWTSENTVAADETAQKKLEEVRSSRLWRNLKAVQNHQVYLVPNYWIGSGPLAANAMIDDLFKYVH